MTTETALLIIFGALALLGWGYAIYLGSFVPL